MSFPKFSEWMSLKEETPGAMVPKGVVPKPSTAGIKKPEDPKVKMLVAASLKKNKGKVNPGEIIDAVSKSGASTQDLLKVAKDVGESS